MSYKDDNPRTRKQLANFTAKQWIEFQRQFKETCKHKNHISERDKRILEELIVNMKSTAELAYLGRHDESYSWLKSNQNKPMSVRRIQQILTKYYPEFHIQKTHKKEQKDRTIRNEQTKIKQHLIKERGFCAWCGTTKKLELHHMIPVSLGGTNDERNLVFMCEECHQSHTNYFKELCGYGGGKKIVTKEVIENGL